VKAALALSVALCAVVTAGCGGGSRSHTYVLTPSAAGRVGARGAGIYLTIVSPVALPESAFHAMRPKMTVVPRSAGPEVCSYHQEHWIGHHWARLTVTINGSNPLAAALCSGKSPSDLGPTGANFPVEMMGPTGLAGTSGAGPTPRRAPGPHPVPVPWPASVAPVVVSAPQLRSLSQLLYTPIYWIGPERGYRYQFSTGYGRIWVRYLPRGASAEATDRRFRVVGTYRFPGAHDELRFAARGKVTAGPRGSIYLRMPAYNRPVLRRKNVLIAFRRARDNQIEVFDPHPTVAAKIASTGRIRRVGG